MLKSKSDKKMSELNESITLRISVETKEELSKMAEELNTSVSKLTRKLLNNIVKEKETLKDVYYENKKKSDIINNYVDNTFQTYLEQIKPSTTKADCVIFLRQSVKNDAYIARYERMKRQLVQSAREKGFKNIKTVFYQDLSGFFAFKEVLKYLMATSVKAIFIGEITRLSRNIEAYLTILNYAFKNHKKVYLNNTNITFGSGYLSGLIQAIFAEMELLSKQTRFSKYMFEVAKFLNEKIVFDEIKNEKVKKLCILSKYADREAFIDKMMEKAIEVVEKDDTSENLKSVAREVLEEFR